MMTFFIHVAAGVLGADAAGEEPSWVVGIDYGADLQVPQLHHLQLHLRDRRGRGRGGGSSIYRGRAMINRGGEARLRGGTDCHRRRKWVRRALGPSAVAGTGSCRGRWWKEEKAGGLKSQGVFCKNENELTPRHAFLDGGCSSQFPRCSALRCAVRSIGHPRFTNRGTERTHPNPIHIPPNHSKIS